MHFFYKATRRGAAVAVVAFLAILNLVSPASAAGGGGGIITGTVSIGGSPVNGIPLDPGVSSNNTYTFSSTNLTGVFTDGDQAIEASVNVTASGGASGVTSSTGSGSVTINSCSGSGTMLADPDIPTIPPETADVGKGAAITCSGGGSFSRVGPISIVALALSICITGPTADDNRCVNATVVVVALFTPTPPGLQCKDANGIAHCVTQAAFAGVFAGAGT